MTSKDRSAKLEELTRHLKGLGKTVMEDLEADFRRMQLLISSSEMLVEEASKPRGVSDAMS